MIPVLGDKLRAWDSLRRVLRVQVVGQPFDFGTEPAPQPVSPFPGDMAEGSDVVAEDGDLQRRIEDER